MLESKLGSFAGVVSRCVSSALSRVKAISDSLEAFILEVKRTPGVYKGAISIENDSKLQGLSRWSLLLIHRTEQMLKKRFDFDPWIIVVGRKSVQPAHMAGRCEIPNGRSFGKIECIA